MVLGFELVKIEREPIYFFVFKNKGIFWYIFVVENINRCETLGIRAILMFAALYVL